MIYSNAFSSPTRGGALKFYAEVHCDVCSAATLGVGIADAALSIDNAKVGGNITSSGWYADGTVLHGSTSVGTAPTWSAGDWLAISYDTAVGVRCRNITQNSAWSGAFSVGVSATTPVFLVISADRLGDAATANFDGTFLGAPYTSDYVRWDGTALVAAATGTLAASEAADVAAIAGEAAVVEPPFVISLPGARPELRPLPVEGYGFGILPELEGEAFGTVFTVAGSMAGAVDIKLAASVEGAAGVAGDSVARLRIRGAGDGDAGQAGNAMAVLKNIRSASCAGVAGVCGKGSGTIAAPTAVATAHIDDDDAIIVWLLAA